MNVYINLKQSTIKLAISLVFILPLTATADWFTDSLEHACTHYIHTNIEPIKTSEPIDNSITQLGDYSPTIRVNNTTEYVCVFTEPRPNYYVLSTIRRN